MDKECAIQMAAEFKRPRINKFTGKREMVYVCPSGNNHALDLAKEQVLCASVSGFIPAGLELEAEKEVEKSNLKA